MIEIISEDCEAKRYRYKLTGLKRMDLTRDMALFWEKLLTVIQIDRPDGSWNRILFECWRQDGYVLAYPQKRGESPDKHVPSVVADLDYLISQQATFDTTEDKETLEGLMNLAYIDTAAAIRDSYRREPALTKLKEVLTTNDFKAYTMPEDDVELLMEFEIYFK